MKMSPSRGERLDFRSWLFSLLIKGGIFYFTSLELWHWQETDFKNQERYRPKLLVIKNSYDEHSRRLCGSDVFIITEEESGGEPGWDMQEVGHDVLMPLQKSYVLLNLVFFPNRRLYLSGSSFSSWTICILPISCLSRVRIVINTPTSLLWHFPAVFSHRLPQTFY